MATQIFASPSLLNLSSETYNPLFARSFKSPISVSMLKPQSTVVGSARFGFARRCCHSLVNNVQNRSLWPEEILLIPGCDFEHWLVVVEELDKSWSRDQIIESYIIGSE
ncbi:OLC1v1030883C1 [Oldenlandia corymbosa var. corymbosa]|uniref:OLC1v1030883C1 n=1 Tax=Oldenlandia corymbosa var. corymbosa TaxID=529605 RepID=A0AAV1CI66_OLDCO|nr:OLC1v1030883C1 [Oldenlandia corymbosa var. corymbosa]